MFCVGLVEGFFVLNEPIPGDRRFGKEMRILIWNDIDGVVMASLIGDNHHA
jgi:hypothetical protein